MPSQRLVYLIISTIAASETIVGSSHFSNCINARYVAPAFIAPGKSNLQGVPLCAHSTDLDTAYEWLAKDRVLNEPERHEKISWFDPDTTDSGKDHDGTEIQRMPLYPLGAVHVPHSGENHTIINTEPQNVKMALDLVNGKWENSLFCTSIRARDTNGIASVGTVMQLLDIDDRSISGARTWPGDVLPTLNRVVANCRAVGIVDILSIEEHDYQEDDYLIAQVKVHKPSKESNDDSYAPTASGRNEERDAIAQQVIDDYQKVRSIYINSQSLASNELPKFARKAVQTLPTFHIDIVHDETKFWKLVETWQMLCNTIRQSKQTQLQGIVNELSVSVAMQAKGPLQLPVKRKSLPSDVQRQLLDIEQSASRDFMELGMEPVLDFQEILSMKDHWGRVEKLAWMIQRERSRLEAKESLIRAFMAEEFGVELLTSNLDGGDQNTFD
mmetsp:Transcript_30491/g.64562  ORF Transcript_30491/g.64562 Transcript_30491/m.64562 type:complete len:442 (+) Transcript_30491:70-1395(+)|eukprot:CAMPEP_0172304492 /NCGR_PEP_ID=MMETSP1058-20130122/5888_1 /TAXON_ID=83371 /ORGANISM="Detonula confervacea, Strain CCMP 353" /LENGTH=441 /DNA_ID=CAMNT_0013015737 /DNA_START=5 /DNA_END=1333 /DNA_ORIENTATION=+